MRHFMAIVCLAGALYLPARAETSLGLIQPDAGLVFGVEWRRIVDSSIGDMLTEQLKKADLPKVPGIESIQNVLLHDLDSVLIASSATALGKATGQPPALVVVKGRFNVEQLQTVLRGTGQKVEKYHGVDLIVASAGKASGSMGMPDQTVAFVDSSTILAGDTGEVRRAIDRMKTGKVTKAAGGILDGVTDLAARNDLWMVLEIPASAWKEAPPQMAQMFSGVTTTEMGMSFGQGLGIQISIRAKDETSAKSIGQGLQGLLAIGAMSQSDNPQVGEMMKKIQITSEGQRVKLALSLDRSELEKIVRESQAARPAPTTAPTRAPEPSGPKSVRITGLDSGPVDVPLSETRK